MTIDSRKSEGMHDDPHWEAIARFHAGESTAEESERVRAHLAANPLDQLFLTVLQEDGTDPERTISAEDVDRALVAVRRRLIAVDEPTKPVLKVVQGGSATRANTAGNRRWQFGALAAAAVLAIAVMSSNWTSAGERPFTEAMQQRVTLAMQQDSLTLVDGTRVVLGAGSRIDIDSGFNRAHRTVKLEGMAQFTVAHEGSHPFIVRTAGADVQDIGTAFVVKATNDGGVVVSVTDGSVRLTRAGQSNSVDLVAGERAVIPSAGGTPTIARNVDTQADAAWRDGHLAYRDAPVSEVLNDIARWYGVTVNADNALLGRTLRADLVTDSLSEALRAVALALGAEVIGRDKEFHLASQEGSRTR